MLKDMDSGELVVSSIRAGMKREFALMMKAQAEMGGLSAGRRRVTRSQSTGCASNVVHNAGKISKKANEPDYKKIKKDEEETLGGEAVQKFELIDVSDGEEGKKGNVVDLGSDVGDDFRSLEPQLGAIERTEPEEVGSDSRECTIQPLVTESPLPQVGCSDGVSHEDDGTISGASDLGCKRTGEATSSLAKEPLRRYTRSALKPRNEEMELGSSAGVVESGSSVTLTTSPSKLELKMSKKVGLKRVPRRLKDLLETGLLEGLHVQYVHGSKVNYLVINLMCVLDTLLIGLFSLNIFRGGGDRNLNFRELFRELEYYVHVMNAREERLKL